MGRDKTWEMTRTRLVFRHRVEVIQFVAERILAPWIGGDFTLGAAIKRKDLLTFLLSRPGKLRQHTQACLLLKQIGRQCMARLWLEGKER